MLAVFNNNEGKLYEVKILVTGANGYLGRFVVNTLLNRGHEVVASDLCYDRTNEKAVRSCIPIFSGDENIYKTIGRPDTCIHLAWRNGFIHDIDSHMSELSDHYIFLSNMIYGGLRHLAVMGTMHEIGYWEGAIDQDTPANPISKYGIAKNCLRAALTNICNKHKEVVFQWLRAYYVTGDDLHNNSIFRKLLEADAIGQKIFPFTSGKNLYDFIDVNELASQIVAVSCQSKFHGIINCCSGNPVSLAERVNFFIKEHDLSIKLNYGAFPDRPYDSPGVWGDNKKIKEVMMNFSK